MNRETRTRWYNHKCSKCSAHPFVIIIRIVLYALVRYLRPTLYNINQQQKELCTPNAYIHRNINSAAEIRISQVTCRNCILKNCKKLGLNNENKKSDIFHKCLVSQFTALCTTSSKKSSENHSNNNTEINIQHDGMA